MKEIIYQLSKKEILEAWRSAHWRTEVFQKINRKILLLLSVLFAAGYCIEPEKLYLLLGTAAATLLLFYDSYFRIWQQERKAEKMENGRYKIAVGEQGIYAGEAMDFYDLRERKWEFLESESVYTIKAYGELFCIPKREISEETECLENLRKMGCCCFRKIVTERKN